MVKHAKKKTVRRPLSALVARHDPLRRFPPLTSRHQPDDYLMLMVPDANVREKIFRYVDQPNATRRVGYKRADNYYAAKVVRARTGAEEFNERVTAHRVAKASARPVVLRFLRAPPRDFNPARFRAVHQVALKIDTQHARARSRVSQAAKRRHARRARR
jgi:hypothetical protein